MRTKSIIKKLMSQEINIKYKNNNERRKKKDNGWLFMIKLEISKIH
jgi:hypothetical protein